MRDNIIVITIDSLRADHCGYINESNRQLTPAMTRFADEGIAYQYAFAPGPRTPSSIPPTMTGQFHQYRDWGESGDWRRRRARIGAHLSRHQSLAEKLSQIGYDTAAYTTNPWTARDTNFDTGFRVFNEVTDDDMLDFSGNTPIKLIDELLHKANTENSFGWQNKREWFSQWPSFYDRLQSLVDELREPYFLWVFLLDCHQPYFTPSRFREETNIVEMYYSVLRYWNNKNSNEKIPDYAESMLKRSYRDTVRSVDIFLDKLMKDTEDDNPKVVIHADHGEAHGEHGTYGHEKQLYDVNLHVPLIIYNTDQRATLGDQISLRQLPQLVFDLANSDRFAPDKYTADVVTSMTEFAEKTAVRSLDWKYIQSEAGSELYHLKNDPEETHSCVQEFSQAKNVLQNRLNHLHSDLREKQHVTHVIPQIISE